jgi:cell division protein FtsN
VNAARVLADSLVTALPNSSFVMPEALFAKASIAPSAAEAERDYSRIVNEFRFSPRVPDALMRLGLLESARNNRVSALRHLERLLRDHNDAPVRSRASLLAGRMRLEANDLARACDLFAAAYASAGINERDVKEQAESLGEKCPTPVATMAQRDPPPLGIARAARPLTTTSMVAPPPATVRRNARRDSVARPVARRDTAPAAKPVTPVIVARDTVPTPKPPAPVIRRDTAVVAKPVAPAVRRDTMIAPKPPVVRRDTVAPAKPAAPVVARRDTVIPPKPAVVATPVVARRDTVPTPKPAAPVVRRDTTPTPAPTPKPVARDTAPSSAPAVPASSARYGVQFAAYNDKPGAEKFASVLRERGITARVEGTSAPFRVRAGRFTTRAEAEASAALWRRPGQPAIVVSLGPTP